MQARRHLMRLSNGHDRENNTTQQLQASKTPSLGIVLFEDVFYDRAKNTMQRLKTSKRIFAQVSESFDSQIINDGNLFEIRVTEEQLAALFINCGQVTDGGVSYTRGGRQTPQSECNFPQLLWMLNGHLGKCVDTPYEVHINNASPIKQGASTKGNLITSPKRSGKEKLLDGKKDSNADPSLSFSSPIKGYRMSLWAKHIRGLESNFERPESLECVRTVRWLSESNWNQYAAIEVTDMKAPHAHIVNLDLPKPTYTGLE
ncbi:phospholipase D gamma 1 [Artemisia annua]|uniref:Phospholipase D gamma 1 n=1 Tax=Artemisia annua TaxID=35608 RepID=A0A2U1NTG2_ARTAN|nr:phospholipase D gamma 1 [Artemisia annua]